MHAFAEECCQNFHIHAIYQQRFTIRQRHPGELPNLMFIAKMVKLRDYEGLKDMFAGSNVYVPCSIESILVVNMFQRTGTNVLETS